MAKFFSLSSSSKGNSYLVSSGETSVLIDAGISFKQINLQLKKYDISINDIDAILITHEHSDHVRGINVLSKNVNIPIYSAKETLDFLADKGALAPGSQITPIETGFSIGEIHVKAFDTSHDAVHSLGFRLDINSNCSIGFATDLGTVTETVRNHLEGCELVVLESNFDPRMLECSMYPYVTKRRIKSEFGHLANEECASEIAHLVHTGSTRFVLGHLSEQNNMPQIAYETTRSTLEQLDIIEGADYLVSIAPAREAGEMVIL